MKRREINQKPYSTAHYKPYFDWNKFLFKKKVYTKDELDEASHDAARWVTCACGNVCNVIPRDSDGAPLDKKLQAAGRQFCADIEELNGALFEDGWQKSTNHSLSKEGQKEFNQALRNARETLCKIEIRSEQLLKQINKKNGKEQGRTKKNSLSSVREKNLH